MDLGKPGEKDTLLSLYLKIWSPETRGYAVKTTSYATPMSY